MELKAGRCCLRLDARGAEFRDETLLLRASAPELHGTLGVGREQGWVARLAFNADTTSCAQGPVDVPNVGQAPGLVIASRIPAESNVQSLSFTWRLTFALHEDSLLLHMVVALDEGAPTPVTLEHICFATLEVEALWDRTDIGEDGTTTASIDGKPARPQNAKRFGGFCSQPGRGPGHSSLLVNGWQSFGFSGVLHGAVAQPTTCTPYFSGAFHNGAVLPKAMSTTWPRALTSDMFGVFWLHTAGIGLLGGFLSQQNGFGALAAHSNDKPVRLLLFTEVDVVLRPGVDISTDWAVVMPISPVDAGSDANNLTLKRYFALMASHQKGAAPKPQPVGWCSWYCHGPCVDEELMLDSLARLSAFRDGGELPLKLFQLDDGWQSAWGDWLQPNLKRFPNGLTPLAQRVRDAGMTPGIWLAPAALVADSSVAKAHPDWLLRDAQGRPVKCGFTAPGLWMLALDTTREDVLAHIHKVIHTLVHEWGFSYLKCDFLHCAAMGGARRHDTTVPRSRALRMCMETVRKAAGDSTFVLACGAPLGPCVGLVDAIRVSADTAEHWLPKGPDVFGTRWFFAGDRTNLPAARNMVCSTMARMPMHGSLWVNDPDCLILRDDFSLQEAQALATVAALSAGSLIFSDSVDNVHPERLAILKALLPPLSQAAQHIDLLAPDIPGMAAIDFAPNPLSVAMGHWKLIGLFHWTEGSASRVLQMPESVEASIPSVSQDRDTKEWHVFEFWSGSYEQHQGPLHDFHIEAVSPRCCRLFAVRPLLHNVAQFVGSDVHISCGLEVHEWREVTPKAATVGAVEFSFDVGRSVFGPRVWLSLPGAGSKFTPSIQIDGQGDTNNDSCPAPQHVLADVWRFTLPSIASDKKRRFFVEW